MGQEEVERIEGIFSRLDLHPAYREHEAVVTSQDAAKTRGDELRQGIKALLFTNGKGEWVIVNVPAHLKVDMKKVCAKTLWSRGETRMATPEEVVEKTGCEIGAVPPFGHKDTIPLLVDIQVYDNVESAFNIGLRTRSVKIKTAEMKVVFEDRNAREGDFAKA
jgi:prolyl-tRNA editing enzyme YbaK/EbsC (Cys-tRNA(Pro) deacylase)